MPTKQKLSFLHKITEPIEQWLIQLFCGALGGIIGCYSFLFMSLMMEIRGTTNGRIAMFIGIVIGTCLGIYLARRISKKHRSKFIILAGFLLVLVMLLWATAL